MAIENCQQKALPVKEIYAWIVQHFPYFKTAPTGWKNSVRHNLSLNKCFQKVEKAAVSPLIFYSYSYFDPHCVNCRTLVKAHSGWLSPNIGLT